MNTYAVDTLRDKYGRNFKLLDFMEQSVTQLRLNEKLSYKEIVAGMIVVGGRGPELIARSSATVRPGNFLVRVTGEDLRSRAKPATLDRHAAHPP
jgi:hypothetical protein